MSLILHTDCIGIEVQLQRETFQQKVKYFHQQRQELSLNGEAKTHLGFYLIVKKIFSEKRVKKHIELLPWPKAITCRVWSGLQNTASPACIFVLGTKPVATLV